MTSAELDWNRIIDTLYAGGFDGTVAVEHEDPVWGGSNERIEQGLLIAASTLRPLILDNPTAKPHSPSGDTLNRTSYKS